MTPPIALQLYTVRDALAGDYPGTISTIAQMGYAGVEMAGQYHQSPEQTARLLRDSGLTVCAAHMPLPLGAEKNLVLETLAALDCRRLVCAHQPPESFQTADGIRRVCGLLNEAAAVAREHGLAFGYHNHWWEYLPVNGQTADRLLLDGLDPGVLLEVDIYWVKAAGQDPAQVVQALGERAPLLHVKDGPATVDAPMTALGEGVVDIEAAVRASAAEWLIVELDHCATDMLAAVQKSYIYLTSKGLGHGRNG